MAQPGSKIVGFMGAAGSGKSSAASFVAQQYGFTQYSMAQPLKSMIRMLLIEAAYSHMEAHNRMMDRTWKEAPMEELSGKTLRHAMQTLGTEWGRTQMHPDFWVNFFKMRLDRFPYNNFVLDDIRFQNEADFIKAQGGLTIGIYRPDGGAKLGALEAKHVSEELPEPMVWLENDADLGSLLLTVRQILIDREIVNG